MKTKLLTFLSVSAFLLVAACDNTPKKPEPTEAAEEHNEAKIDDNNMEKDAEFLVKAADGNMKEIEAGKLAEKNGRMGEVKAYGKMLVEHHTKMLDDIKSLAAAKNITLPTGMSDDNRKDIEDLSGKAGKEFDKAFIDAMEDDHESDLKDFEDKSTSDKADADVRNLAIQALPVLREHLAQIKKIEEKYDQMKK